MQNMYGGDVSGIECQEILSSWNTEPDEELNGLWVEEGVSEE